jgi:hypothetical protein
MIDGQSYPYSPSMAGAQKARALLDDAVAAVRDATAPRQCHPGDLEAATERAIAKMKEEGLLVEEQLPRTGRFRRGRALRVDKSHIPSSDTGSDGSPLGDPEASGEEDMPDAAKLSCRGRDDRWPQQSGTPLSHTWPAQASGSKKLPSHNRKPKCPAAFSDDTTLSPSRDKRRSSREGRDRL